MKKFSIVFVFLVSLLLNGCGLFTDLISPTGNRVTEEYSATGFNKIAISGAMSLKVINGTQHVEIETYENIHDYIKTSVRNKELTIEIKNKVSFTRNPAISIYVTADLLSKISLSGSTDVHFINYKTDDITVKASGSSDILGELTASSISFDTSGSSEADLSIDCQEFTNEASGSCHYRFAGNADNYKIISSGSSKIDGFNLVTKHTDIKASGSSRINLTVLETLNVDVSGSSHIRYKGNPRIGTQKISGSGKVEKM